MVLESKTVLAKILLHLQICKLLLLLIIIIVVVAVIIIIIINKNIIA
jgi:hypothetical protein